MTKRGPKTKLPLVRAIDFYFYRTQRGEMLCQGKAEGKYLRNRVEEAFIAGWDACEKAVTKALKGGE